MQEKELNKKVEILKEIDQKELTGLREISFKILCKGQGILNTEGNKSDFAFKLVKSEDGNYIFPKLKMSSTTVLNKENEEINEYNKRNYKLFITSQAFKNNMFKEIGLKNIETAEGVKRLLLSSTGLLNGYVVPIKPPCNRSSSALLTDLSSDLTKEDIKKYDIDFYNKPETEQLLPLNGVIEMTSSIKGEVNQIDVSNKKAAGDKNNNYFFKAKTLLDNCYYKSEGMLFIERLQFICTGGELGKQHAVNIFNDKKELEEFSKVMSIFLNYKKQELNNLIKEKNSLKEFIDNNEILKVIYKDLYEKEEEIKVDFGKYRYAGNLVQLLDNVTETGLKLNSAGVKLLILNYFILLKNNVISKNNAFLEVEKVIFDKEDLLMEEDSTLKISNFYIKVE